MIGALLRGAVLAVLIAAPAVAQNVVTAPEVPQARGPNEIVGFLLRNPTRTRLAPGFASFGQIFMPGQLRPGTSLAASIAGRPAPVQLDAKATNADGSLRMAVLTVPTPALEPGQSVRAMLVAGAPSNAAPVEIGGGTDMQVTLQLQGEASPHVLRLDALAARAGNQTAWLRGPLATEIRVDAPVAGSLHVVFDLRRHKDGSALIDVSVANDLAMQPVGGDVTYDVTIAQHGAVLFQQQGVHQFQYTDWHKQFRTTGSGEPDVVHDVAYLERTGAILDYDLRAGVAETALAAELAVLEKGGPGFDILGNADLHRYMGDTGGRPDIGPTTEANTIWLVTQNPIAETFALAQDDAAGSIPWHMLDPSAGTYLTTLGHPNIWVDPRGGTNGTSGLTQRPRGFSRDCGCWSLDSSHQPDLSYIPYILTGSHYRLDELAAQAAWDVTGTWPGPRKNGEGIVADLFFQVRGIAWNLRGLGNAAYILPDAHPLKEYFRTLQARNLAYLQAQAQALDPREGETHGWLIGQDITHRFLLAPWQQDYLGFTVAAAAKQGVPTARALLDWQSNFLVGRFLALDKGFSPYDGPAYQLDIAAIGSAEWPSTWRELDARARAAGYSSCPSPAELANCSWQQWAYPQYRHQAVGIVSEIGHVLHQPDATKARAWLDQHGGVAKFGITNDVRFNIAAP